MDKIIMPKRIETERLVIRKHVREDSVQMFATVDKNREIFEKILPWVKPTQSLEDSKAYIESTLKYWDEGVSFDFSLFIKDSGKYIGNLGLHTLSLQNLRGEFGYWIDSGAQGKGYMTEAVAKLERVCFKAGLNRLEIRCAPSNLKSARVAEKLGYQLEGDLRENFLVNGVAQNTLIYAKLKSDMINI